MTSYQQVLDATDTVELHHFRGTSVVVCCLVTVKARAIFGFGAPIEGEETVDMSTLAMRAREAANAELAKQLDAEDAKTLVDLNQEQSAAPSAPRS